mgnify:CR=1 FL=1
MRWAGGVCALPALHPNCTGEPMPTECSTPKRVCSFEGCGRDHEARGLCVGHRAQASQGKTLAPLRERARNGEGWRRGERKVPAYKQWRLAVFARDEFTCQLCRERGGRLEANHIRRWAETPLLRFHIPNGITLCRKCHRGLCGKEAEWERRFTDIVRGKPVVALTEKQLASLRPVIRVCLQCGGAVSRQPAQARRCSGAFCDHACRAKWYASRHQERACDACGRTFDCFAYEVTRRFCSIRCRRASLAFYGLSDGRHR